MTSIVSQGENRWRGNKTTFVIVYFKPAVVNASCSTVTSPVHCRKSDIWQREHGFWFHLSVPLSWTLISQKMHREKRSENHFARWLAKKMSHNISNKQEKWQQLNWFICMISNLFFKCQHTDPNSLSFWSFSKLFFVSCISVCHGTWPQMCI